MKLNNDINGKSIYTCSVCGKQIEMNEVVYMTDRASCLFGGHVAHFFCVINSLQQDFERTHRVVRIHLNECDNAESLMSKDQGPGPGEWVCF